MIKYISVHSGVAWAHLSPQSAWMGNIFEEKLFREIDSFRAWVHPDQVKKCKSYFSLPKIRETFGKEFLLFGQENLKSGGWAVPSSDQVHFVWFGTMHVIYRPINTNIYFC